MPTPIFGAREGFTIDSVLSILDATVLNPWFTGVCLIAVCARDRTITYPDWPAALDQVLPFLSQMWRETVRPTFGDRNVLHLLTTVCVGLAIRTNRRMSRGARNNWVWDTSYDWKKEIVVVTGGAAGFGADIVQQLDTRGIQVVVLDVGSLTYRPSSRVHYYKCDVSNPQDVASVAKAIVSNVGHPTILVNNAGVFRGATILSTTPRDLDMTYDINVKAHYHLTKAFLPNMISKNHGHIVTVSSATAYAQACSGVSYCSSKAAILSFHEGLSEEILWIYKAPKVRTSVICPGHVNTAMFTGIGAAAPSFMAPALHPSTVAETIVDVLLSCESQHVLMPAAMHMSVAGRALPTWFFRGLLASGKDTMGSVVRR